MSKILILGGGVAGLTAGIYSRLLGNEAHIFEQAHIAGGNLTGWHRDGYEIDNCIHWLTGTNPSSSLYKMWCEVGALGGVDIVKQPTLYTYEKDGVSLSLCRSVDELEENMLCISPEDSAEIKSFTTMIRTVQGLDGVGGQHNNKGLGLLGKIAAVPKILKYHSMTTGELAARFKSPVIRAFITALLEDKFSSMALIYVFAAFTSGNGDIPVGGSLAMAKRMTDKFISLGGNLHLGCGVTKINHAEGKAHSLTLSNGTEIEGDFIIITADPASVFGKILNAPMPKALKAMYDDPKKERFSAYHTAFACDTPTLPFRGDYIFEVPEEYRCDIGSNNLVLREFSHAPSSYPEGKSLIQTMTFCYEKTCADYVNLRESDREKYKERKERLISAVQGTIISRFPELDGKLRCIDCWTPATYKRYTGSEVGSFMSFVMPAGSPPSSAPSTVDGLSNVLVATQWQQAPGGLPIAARCGKAAARNIDKLLKKC